MLDISGGTNTGEPGEKPSEQGREPTTNSTHIIMVPGRNQTRVTLVGGERSHYCTIPAKVHIVVFPGFSHPFVPTFSAITFKMITKRDLKLFPFILTNLKHYFLFFSQEEHKKKSAHSGFLNTSEVPTKLGSKPPFLFFFFKSILVFVVTSFYYVEYSQKYLLEVGLISTILELRNSFQTHL